MVFDRGRGRMEHAPKKGHHIGFCVWCWAKIQIPNNAPDHITPTCSVGCSDAEALFRSLNSDKMYAIGDYLKKRGLEF